MKYCDTCRSAYPPEYNTCPRDQAVLRVASELIPGMVLRGKYEVLEKIGQGGMASVYRAKHLAFGEVRAIKVVGPLLAGDEEFQKRFRSEAVITRRLQHPNAVRVDDLDTTDDGRPFIVMEHVVGRSLRDVIRNESPLAVRRAAGLARQVAAALGAAHALGIVHRDIKPDNILISTDAQGQEHVKVLDFGIAKVLEGAFETGGGHAPTQTGMVVGTPQYMSPEQAMGKRGSDLDGRTDLYALGIIVYEMVTGRLPFESDTPMGLLLHHLQTPAPPLHQVRPDLGFPPALGAFLNSALSKDRDRRFASAAEMEAALAALADGPATALSPRPTLPATRPTASGASTAALVSETTPTAELPRSSTTPRPPITAARRPRPVPTPPPASEASDDSGAPSSTPVLLVSGLVILLVVGSVLWRSTRGAPAAGVASPPPVEAPATEGLPAEARAQAPEARDRDARLHNEVQRLLVSSSAVRAEPITVEVVNGIVTLGGSAGSTTAAQIAESLAASVPGVSRVFNTIQVAGVPVSTPPATEPAAPRETPSQRTAEDTRDTSTPPPGRPDLRGPAGEAAELIERGKRALMAGNAQAALQACQAALQIQPQNPFAQACMMKARAGLGGPGPRRH